MKTIIILVLLLSWHAQSVAQLTPMFQTDIYFEDAKGNRDTITVGFDTLAISDYNPNFGELDITTPFDSIFEVRASRLFDFGWGNGSYTLSKKIIGSSENYINFPSCYTGTPIIFFIHATNLPVRISWNNTDLIDACLDASYFTPDRMNQLINPWDWFDMPSIRYACASLNNNFELYLGQQFKAPMEIPYIAKKKIIGSPNAVDSIYGVTINFTASWALSPCRLVATSEASFELDNQTEVFPNPAIDELNVRNKDKAVAANIFIHDQTGKTISYLRDNNDSSAQQIDVLQFPSGVYYVVQHMKNGSTRVNKWVKM